jgi:hypothetical protein
MARRRQLRDLAEAPLPRELRAEAHHGSAAEGGAAHAADPRSVDQHGGGPGPDRHQQEALRFGAGLPQQPAGPDRPGIELRDLDGVRIEQMRQPPRATPRDPHPCRPGRPQPAGHGLDLGDGNGLEAGVAAGPADRELHQGGARIGSRDRAGAVVSVRTDRVGQRGVQAGGARAARSGRIAGRPGPATERS